MELIGDVKQGMMMIKYLNTHPEKFSSTWIPFIIALMQFTGGFVAEFTNLFMLATRTSVEMCITFFVAFHVLTAIDNIYAEGMSDLHLKEAVEEPLEWERSHKSIKFADRSNSHRCVRIVDRCLFFLYNTIYYYYLPFLVNLIPYISPGAGSGPAAEH